MCQLLKHLRHTVRALIRHDKLYGCRQSGVQASHDVLRRYVSTTRTQRQVIALAGAGIRDEQHRTPAGWKCFGGACLPQCLVFSAPRGVFAHPVHQSHVSLLAEHLPASVVGSISGSQVAARAPTGVQHGLPRVPQRTPRLIVLPPPFADGASAHPQRGRLGTKSTTWIRCPRDGWFVMVAIVEALVGGTGIALHGVIIRQ